jgi:hypothetical protein
MKHRRLELEVIAVARGDGLDDEVGVAVMASDARSLPVGAGEATNWGKRRKNVTVTGDRRHQAKIKADGNRVDGGLELNRLDGRYAVARGKVDADVDRDGCSISLLKRGA